MAMTAAELDLPGFRFHPTEEELLDFYLKNVVLGKNLRADVIGHLNLYRYDPCDLPGKSKICGEREWYFYVPRERKHGSGGRPNRTTENGFWKATGSDRKIVSQSEPKRIIGLRKTLVFYKGRAPKGTKTDWVMNEYRLPDSFPKPKDIVLCKIYRKATSLKVLEQRAAMEEESRQLPSQASSSVSSFDSFPFQEDPVTSSISPLHQIGMTLKKEAVHDMAMTIQDVHDMAMTIQDDNINEMMKGKGRGPSLQLPMGKLPELHLPKSTVDWNPDSFLLSSPWLQYFSPCYADILNF